MSTSTPYGIKVKTKLDFDSAIDAVIAALSTEGFGILTRIDVKETLEAKLGIEFRPYVILVACNPKLADRGLELEPDLGLLLPCNVVVQLEADGVVVSAMDPGLMVEVTDNPAMSEVADEARVRLERAINALI